MFGMKKVKELENQIVDLEDAIKEHTQYEQHLEKEYEKLVEDTSDTRIENAELRAKLTLVNCDLELAGDHITKLESLIDNSSTKIKELEDHIMFLNSVVESGEKDGKADAETISEHETTIQQLSEENLTLTTENERLTQRVKMLESSDDVYVKLVVNDLNKAEVAPFFQFNDTFVEQCIEGNYIQISNTEAQKRATELLLMTMMNEVTGQLLDSYAPGVNNE